MPSSASVLALAAGLLVAAPALAQTPCPDNNPPVGNSNCVTNPSFETVNQFSGSMEPLGWHNISNPAYARRRTVGDGLLPALAPVGTANALTPHTGNACIQLGTDGFGGFIGFTTDTVNFTLPTFPYYDPVFDYNGGDVIITTYYMIPTNQAITGSGEGFGDAAYIKVNIKVNNQDVASFENYNTDPLGGAIVGTTNGQWRLLTIRIAKSEIVRQYECNRGIRPDCGCNCVPDVPPTHIKLTPSRYGSSGNITTGTVFFDDVTYTQLAGVPACHGVCVADFDDGSSTGHPDGGVGIEDLLYYLGLYNAGVTCADVDDGSGTGVEDGGVGIEDLLYYLVRYNAGC